MNQLQGKTVGKSRKRSKRNRKSACCFPESTADVLLAGNELCGFIAVASEITGLSLDSPGQYSHGKLAGLFMGFSFFFFFFHSLSERGF